MKRFLPLLLAVAPLFSATITHTAANPLNYDGTPVNGNTQTTNWNESVSLPLFDATLGTLTKVTLTLDGGVFGNVSLESLDAAPATVNYTLGAMITATGISGLSVNVAPASNGSDNFSAFDGTIDFGGTSGAAHLGLTDTDLDMVMSTAAAVLAAYTGVGNFNVDLAAVAASSATGAGNLITQFSTRAGAGVSVTYEYTAAQTAVPEPGSLILMGAGLAGLALIRRRK